MMSKRAIAIATALLSLLVELLTLTALSATALALTDAVQSAPMGPALLSAALAFAVHWLSTAESALERRKEEVQDDAAKFQWKRILSAAIIPIALSWSLNETPYGALNPSDYWRREHKEANEENCKAQQVELYNAAESVQISQKKHELGIETSKNLLDDIATLKIAADIMKKCKSKSEERRVEVQKRLQQLERRS